MISVRSLVLPERDPTPSDVGGRACLALVNSEVWRLLADDDMLATPADCVSLLRRAGQLSDGEAADVAALCEHDPGEAAAALARLHDLRAPLYRVFWGLHE